METNKNAEKNKRFFFCEKCKFECCKKSNYDKHISTLKHQRLMETNDIPNKKCLIENGKKLDETIMNDTIKDNKKMPKNAEKNADDNFFCKCGKYYKHMSSLCKHKKYCNNDINNKYMHNENEQQELIIQLLKQNKELQQSLIELSKEKYVTNISNNNNCNNKTFNLNFFLNEQCKDAVNMSDFLNSMKIELSDLENTGRLGFVEGISKLLLKNLRALDTYKRPIHCSDLKRQTLYIKDNNKWEKEDDEKMRLKNAIRIVANQNIKKISDWTKAHPECRDSESKKNDQYLHIVSNSMCGGTIEETQKNLDNIVKNIVKEVVIEK